MKRNSITQTVRTLSFAGKKRTNMFLALPVQVRAQALLHLSKHIQFELMSGLRDNTLAEILNFLDPDEVTDLIQLLPKKRQKNVIKILNAYLRESIEILNRFDPKSAAGMMSLNYIQVDATDRISDVAEQVKIHEQRTGRLPVIFILENGSLKGYLPGHELGSARPSENVRKRMRDISTIRHSAAHDEIMEVFRTHPHNKIAVLGDQENILGIIYSDDVLNILRNKEASALYDFAGVHDEEHVLDPAKVKVRYRYKWLITNLATAFLAAFTVSLFDDVISKYVILAVYMPIVAGMGGNAGTQTLAVLVRGIALKQIDLNNAWPTMKREAAAGVMNGLIVGLLVAAVVTAFSGNVRVAGILGAAMVINLFVAGLFGTLIPLVMKRLGKDPATSATIFITTATDILGFMAFLGLATIVLD